VQKYRKTSVPQLMLVLKRKSISDPVLKWQFMQLLLRLKVTHYQELSKRVQPPLTNVFAKVSLGSWSEPILAHPLWLQRNQDGNEHQQNWARAPNVSNKWCHSDYFNVLYSILHNLPLMILLYYIFHIVVLAVVVILVI